MIIGFFILTHILFLFFTSYTFWTFVLINLFYNCINNLHLHVINNDIKQSDNIFIQATIYSCKKRNNDVVKYIDEMLEYVPYYTDVRQLTQQLSMNFVELLLISINLLQLQILNGITMMLKGDDKKPVVPMNMMMSMLPMLLGSNNKQRMPMQAQPMSMNRASVSSASSIAPIAPIVPIIKKPISKPQQNMLLYDSDDDSDTIVHNNTPDKKLPDKKSPEKMLDEAINEILDVQANDALRIDND